MPNGNGSQNGAQTQATTQNGTQPDMKTRVRGLVNDPRFQGLSMPDQRQVLQHITGDNRFAQLTDNDLTSFVAKRAGMKPPTGPQGQLGGIQPPQVRMQPSYTAIGAMQGGTGQSGPFNPQQPAQQFVRENPEQQRKLAAAAAVGAGGTAAVQAVGPAATAALPYVKAMGNWAKENPVQAYMLYQVAREIIPWFRKATDHIKHIPTE